MIFDLFYKTFMMIAVIVIIGLIWNAFYGFDDRDDE